MAAALIVLCGAGLVGRTLLELERADPGFDKERVLIVELAWDFNRLSTAAGSRQFFDGLLPRLRALRGVDAASPILLAPFPTVGWTLPFLAADRPEQGQQNNPALTIELVSPGYFDVFRLRPLRGRVLTDADREGAASVVVLSAKAARILWPDSDALGRQLVPATNLSAPSTVVGIVADTRYQDYRNPQPTIDFAQHQPPALPFEPIPTMVAVRAKSGDPLALVPQITAAVRDVNMGVLVDKAVTLEEHSAAPIAQPRFNATLFAAFALAAVLILATGLFAVLTFAVRMRRRELAIRAAVGALPGRLRAHILRSAGIVVGSGIGIGLAVTLAGTRVLKSMLYNVAADDPALLAVAIGVLVLVALIASLIPAQLAARASPAGLLRDT